MTLTFLDLYNSAASQEWSMYDNDATNSAEFEKSLIIDLNKAVTEILYSFPFSFRERTHIILTVPNQDSYDAPPGLIIKNNFSLYSIKLNSKPINLINNSFELDSAKGTPNGFYLKSDKIVLYPTPAEKFIVTVDYLTLSVGENASGEEIFSLKNSDDTIIIPAYLEEIFKNAVISKTMLNAISSEKDENYSAYKKQAETAYKLLIKYSKGVGLEKTVII